MTVDEKRGIAYISLGPCPFDYGADCMGNDLFANFLLALDARTGKWFWHAQATDFRIRRAIVYERKIPLECLNLNV